MGGRILLSVLIGACFLTGVATAAEERMSFDAKINGHPVRLALDTGAELPILFRRAAVQLGLKLKEPPKDIKPEPGKVMFALAERCSLEIGETTSTLRFAVVDLPSYIRPKIHGVLGWGGISHCVVEIRVGSREIEIRSELATDVSQWLCWTVRPDSNCLIAEISENAGKREAVLIDSGAPGGVHLNSRRWGQWVREHPGRPSTVSALFSPAAGVYVTEEKWANEVRMGGLVLREVPINDKNVDAQAFVGEDYGATLGMYALRQLILLVDAKNGKMYLKTDTSAVTPADYNYNRLGAAFAPKDATSADLVAHVVEAGPAYEAGIRNSDILLSIDGLDATKWQTDPRVLPLSRFWSRPAGTKLTLGIMRGAERVDVAVTLQEIFPGRLP
ncbi:MAG: aspartyl protease family protein [Phycisphaerales bacterium]|nr:MAG: aspartyl protease family protein [Phycisphaerales bacterium]